MGSDGSTGLIGTVDAGGAQLRLLRDLTEFIAGYAVICVFITGIFGNILSLVIFIRVRHLYDATCHYLGYLAVVDTLCIVLVGMRVWLAWGLKFATNGNISVDYFTLSLYGCKILKYLSILSQCLSAWIIVTFSLERAFVVWFPFRRSAITAKRRWLVVVCMTILFGFVSLYSLILSSVYTDKTLHQCYYTRGDGASIQRFTFWQVDFSLFYILPCCVITVTNTAIIKGIMSSHDFRKNATSNREQIKQNETDQREAKAKVERQDRKSLINLLVVSTSYILFLTPSYSLTTYFLYVYEVELSLIPSDPYHLQVMVYLMTIFDQFMAFNYCFNFIIYGCSLPFYRQEVRKMIGY
jgi:hypothetical protein